tara:strand:+ start:68 stop:325 length:258 start_codon:yes stop_codon:yes gene_type:complete
MANEKKKEEKLVIMNDGKEIEFLYSELSEEAKAQYARANELAGQLMNVERQMNELRFLANNYIRFVIDELESDNSEQEVVDDKEK